MKRTSKNETRCLSKNPHLPSSLFDQYLVFKVQADGSCLFWATALAYLAGLKNDKKFSDRERYKLTFSLACRCLFGNEVSERVIKNLIVSFDSVLNTTLIKFTLRDLVALVFRGRVVDLMRECKDEFKESDDEE